MGRCVHFQLQDAGYPHLILQDSSTGHALAHKMITASGTLLQHHQPDLVLLREHQLPDLFRLLGIIAVHIVEEIAADALAASQLSVHISEVICQLHQLGLSLSVAVAGLCQIAEILLGVPFRHQRRAVFYGAGHFLLALALPRISYLIDHRLYPFFCRYLIISFMPLFNSIGSLSRSSEGTVKKTRSLPSLLNDRLP